MALVAAEHDPSSRRRVFAVYVQHGLLGLFVLVAASWLRAAEPRLVFDSLGASGPLLVLLFFAFSTLLAVMKFKLTEEIFVSLAMTAYIAMFPLLGMVMSAWIAVLAAGAQRLPGLLRVRQAGEPGDVKLEWARTFALFSTYGIPVVVAVLLFEVLGGSVPQMEATAAAAGRIAVGGVAMVIMNNLVVARVEKAYGYSTSTTVKTAVIDSSIYLVTIPYAILICFVYGSIGLGGVIAAAFTWILANAVARNLAQIRADREQLIQRLTSLTNIGKTISLDCSTEELLMQIYAECRNMIDVSMFSIALYESSKHELSFELNVVRDELRPKTRLPVGDGLNSWVLLHARPLLMGSVHDERKLGIASFDDGARTESWLGVPMIARDRVIGVISVQSFSRNAFSQGDLVLLTAVANQAAAAIENAHLYRDLEGLNFALEQRVQERTLELREANLHLMAADQSKNQFLASMSHELRTPLNAIIGFSSILLQTTATLLPARLFKMVENIRTAGSHLLDLINDILDLAKIETGKLQLESHSFDLRETVATVDRVIRGMAAERNVSVLTRVDPAISTAQLDEVRVKQILLNLLSNAVKFSHDGGFVHLGVTLVPPEASPLGCEALRIEVSDAGVGIAPEEHDRIFREFYQVPGRQNRGGTGLGLSLTRNFVELHHGTIELQSEPGKGATFIVHLPREIPAVAPEGATGEVHAGS